MSIKPYLFFEGKCEEALGFYQKTLGAELLMLMRYKESPDKPPPGCLPPDENKIMHCSFKIGGAEIMASDGMASGTPNFQGFALSVQAKDAAEANRLFAALGDGGQVRMPMGKTFFSPAFGMVADKFGVTWMVIVMP